MGDEPRAGREVPPRGSASACDHQATDTPLVVCIAGNPNVGKSALFTCLTGEEAEAANYPGITVEPNRARGLWSGREVEVVDLPGTYSLGALSGDERVAWEFLLEKRPDVVVAAVDATNLARNLYMVLQLLDLGFHVVVALNMVDEARRRGLNIDERELSRRLGAPVVGTVGSTGEGIGELKLNVSGSATWSGDGHAGVMRYSPDVEARLAELGARMAADAGARCDLCGLTPRAAALAVVEGFGQVCGIGRFSMLRERRERAGQVGAVPAGAGRAVVGSAGAGQTGAADSSGAAGAAAGHAAAAVAGDDVDLALRIAGERHAAAAALVKAVIRKGRRPHAESFWRAATRPLTGVPIAIAVLGSMFAVLFVVGGWVSELLTAGWEAGPAPLIERGVHALLGAGTAGETILWVVNGGIFATLAVGIPYIGVFYFMMALLEDTGYVNAVAYLADRVMHRFGLHGRAVVPLLVAGGCNVPAILGTRVLGSRRERLIAGVLITLVPCSARTAVIVGAVSLYVGWQWALFVYGAVLLVGVAAGLVLDRILPGEPGGLVMEMFSLRRPSLRLVLRKTWKRLRDFVWIAAPIVLVGSLVLGALYETGAVWDMAEPLAPVVEVWLGLPAIAGLTLLFGVLRKELALQLLLAFAVVEYGSGTHAIDQFMTGTQIVVFALVNCLYIPCASTIAVLARELGWRVAAGICVGTLAVALLLGGVVARLLSLG